MRRNPTESCRLEKHERLRKRSDLLNVFGAKNRVGCRGIKLLFRRNELEWNRAAFVAGRGYKSAVKRNREKRRGREIYRRLKSRLAGGYDMIFFLYPGDFSYWERKEQIEWLLTKSGLFSADR